MEPFDIYLASASPRRRELLAQVGVRFRLLEVSVDESRREQEPPEDYVQRLALDKARAGQALISGETRRPVMGADTVVVLGDEVLGKPADRDEALTMLQRLSGREHRVLSGVAVIDRQEYVTLNTSRVIFRELALSECEQYWLTGECHDKAGAYAIQGYAAVFVRELHGSYSGVMGLPLYETAQLLQQVGVGLFPDKSKDKAEQDE